MTTFEKLKKLIAERIGIDEERITPEANIEGDLDFDSLDSIEMVMAAEDEFGVMLDDEELENIRTVHDAVSVLDRALDDAGK